jgi:heptosyltransferase-2/heptosyltransferase-3
VPDLQIHDPRERRLVAAADLALSALTAPRALWRSNAPSPSPRRILLLRLERIGDLVMVLPAIDDVRERAPDAEIDLVVGSWNLPIARAIAAVSRVDTLDAQWLVRGAGGLHIGQLLRRARAWRGRQYDIALNFEPDIRSNLLIAASGARFTAGYASGGGGALLDRALDYDPRAHTTDNARRLVAEVMGGGSARLRALPLSIPDATRQDASKRLTHTGGGPLVGVHVSGGRAIKQWPPEQFAEVARRLADEQGATIVLTGAPEDAALVASLRAALGTRPVIDVSGDVDLAMLAALLGQLDLFVTGDTGPMHLAGAVGTPVVSIFGPSDPARYALRGPHDQVVRVDLPCSPCNRIRRPPDRCVGHTPDCLAGVTAADVFDAAVATLTVSGALDRPRVVPSRAGRA